MFHTHQTAPTQFVEANGIHFAYRRFGKLNGLPLLFNQHYTGTMDHWDPAVTDGFAKDREVILFNNAGVSSSSGEVPTTFQEMGANAVAFIKALGLKKVDVLGFSIGGFVAQEITLQAPYFVRRLVLVGTGPRSGEGMDGGTPEGNRIFGATYNPPDHLWLSVFFTPSPASQAAGREFLKRFRLRSKDRDPEVNDKVAPAQRAAIAIWSAPSEHPYDYLKDIKQPTLVVNGSTDVIIYTVNSFILQQHLPNAELIIYPELRARLAPPISRTVRPRRLDLPVGRRSVGSMNVEAQRTTKETIMPNLSGKTALVTGASRGIGRASALALAAAGAQVLVHYGRGATEADGVVAEMGKAGGRADAVAADLAAADGPHKLAKLARNIVGDRLDILVANAGVSKAVTIEETTVEDFDRLFAVNVRAPFFLVQQLLPILSKGSSVIFLSSLAARGVARYDPGVCGDQGRHRHACQTFRLAARRARYPRQRCRAWRRRNRHVQLPQDRCGTGLGVGHPGA